MAINISDKYPGRANPPSVDYPQGSIKNQTAPGARDGTPLDEAWANDKEGFFQKALSYRGVTANGTPDTATSSQYFDALMSDPDEALRGVPLVATQAETDEGVNDAKMVTPKKLRFGISFSFSINASYIALPSWLGGVIFQFGRVTSSTTADVNATFPLAFPTEIISWSLTPTSNSDTIATASGATTTSIHGVRTFTAGVRSNNAVMYIAVGR